MTSERVKDESTDYSKMTSSLSLLIMWINLKKIESPLPQKNLTSNILQENSCVFQNRFKGMSRLDQYNHI